MKLLEIQIPTIIGREEKFDKLYQLILQQTSGVDSVQIASFKDNREMSIGQKRNKLYEICTAEYVVQIDDDDSLPEYYVEEVLKALESKPDCIGYLESVILNRTHTIACHSNAFADWGNNQYGYDYVRTIFNKDVIKTEIAKQIQFPDIRFAEDHIFSQRLKASGLLQTEVFINKLMYYYSHTILTLEQHNQRYGLSVTK